MKLPWFVRAFLLASIYALSNDPVSGSELNVQPLSHVAIRQPESPNIDDAIAAIDAQRPPQPTSFLLERVKLTNVEFFDETFLDSGAEYAGLPNRDHVEGLILRQGIATFQQIAEESHTVDGGLSCDDSLCRLATPLLIDDNAGLIIAGSAESPIELQLIREGIAFVGNAGELWVNHARIVGWESGSDGPALDPFFFRPFILGVEGSQTVIRDSHLAHLGYDEGSSYGLTLSITERERPLDLPSPTGAILRNEIRGLFYAFYSHGAANVRLIGNTVRGSHKYGIDPHDDSQNLLIARNDIADTGTVSAPGKPPGGHGIIVSRRVVDSWILENKSVANARSGIVVDRDSDRIIVKSNFAAGNAGDGITVYGSDDLWLVDNVLASNGDSGIRVRDSANIVIAGNDIGPHPGYCIKTTQGSVDQAFTSLTMHRNSCHPASRLLRVEGIAELNLIAPAFEQGAHSRPDWSRPRLNGPEPWRNALLHALRNGHSAKFTPISE